MTSCPVHSTLRRTVTSFCPIADRFSSTRARDFRQFVSRALNIRATSGLTAVSTTVLPSMNINLFRVDNDRRRPVNTFRQQLADDIAVAFLRQRSCERGLTTMPTSGTSSIEAASALACRNNAARPRWLADFTDCKFAGGLVKRWFLFAFSSALTTFCWVRPHTLQSVSLPAVRLLNPGMDVFFFQQRSMICRPFRQHPHGEAKCFSDILRCCKSGHRYSGQPLHHALARRTTYLPDNASGNATSRNFGRSKHDVNHLRDRRQRQITTLSPAVRKPRLRFHPHCRLRYSPARLQRGRVQTRNRRNQPVRPAETRRHATRSSLLLRRNLNATAAQREARDKKPSCSCCCIIYAVDVKARAIFFPLCDGTPTLLRRFTSVTRSLTSPLF